MREQPHLGGLQGPTISRVISRDGQPWYDVNIVVRKDRLMPTITELRAIGGSGVVVAPVTYIFEEEPPRYTKLLQVLADS
jgi:ATP phosphoribosyltransferase